MQKRSSLLMRAAVVFTTAAFSVRTDTLINVIISAFSKPVFADSNIPQVCEISHLPGSMFGSNIVSANPFANKSARLFC